MMSLIAGRLASSRRRASACMPSGKRMGNESICVLAMRCLLAFLQHLFGTGQQRLLLVGPHAVQSSREGSHQGQQIVRQFLLRRFFFSWFQNG